jgi:hypothetical protein
MSAIETFLAKLKGKEVTRKQTAAQQWRTAVIGLADGKPPAVEDVDALLVATGKTAEELAREAELLIKRRQAKIVMDRGKAAPAEYDRAFLAIGDAEKKYKDDLDALTKKHKETLEPMQRRMGQLKEEVRQGEQAEQLLRDTALASPEQEAELAMLRTQLEEARRFEAIPARSAQQAAALGEEQERLVALKTGNTSGGIRIPNEHIQQHAEAAKAHAAEAETWRAEAAPRTAARRELEARLAALESTIAAQILNP